MKRAQAYIDSTPIAESAAADKNLASALSDYKKALDLDSTLTGAWLRIVDVYIRQHEFDKAEATLKEALGKAAKPDLIQQKLDEIGSGLYIYSTGLCYRSNKYSSSGEFIWYTTYTYTEDHQKDIITTYTPSGEQISQVKCTYDEQGRTTTFCSFYVDTGELGKMIYEYEDDKHYWEYCYTPSGNLSSYTFHEVTSSEYTKEFSYNPDDELMQIIILEGSIKSKQIKVSYYDPDMNLEWYQINIYGDQGTATEHHAYNADGTLRGELGD